MMMMTVLQQAIRQITANIHLYCVSEKTQLCLFSNIRVKNEPADRYTCIVHTKGGSVAEWLACWTQAQKGSGSNRSRDAVG